MADHGRRPMGPSLPYDHFGPTDSTDKPLGGPIIRS
jgi:hypothetical protein